MEWTTEVGCADSVTFTISAQSGETRPVTIQLEDWAGNNLTVPTSVLCYLTNDAVGIVPTALADADLLIGTNGKLVELFEKVVYQLVSTATGLINVTVTENGVDSYYLVIVLPNGKLAVTAALALV